MFNNMVAMQKIYFAFQFGAITNGPLELKMRTVVWR